MDEFGSGHDQSILDAVSAESQQLAKEHECESSADNKPGEVDKESDDLSDGNTKCFPRFPHFEKFAAEESIENDDFILKMNKKLLHANMTHAASKQRLEALSQKETISTEHERIVNEELPQMVAPPDSGRKIVFDNLDLHIEHHEMTEENQSKDIHLPVNGALFFQKINFGKIWKKNTLERKEERKERKNKACGQVIEECLQDYLHIGRAF
eukprot:Seg1684.4 transcript_id=Seg1684.4/GoldUCD/mRNA.D3Y31 product="hypothetical protein" protein_id=Seg1684.4/GoldUCD/D3Y31